jgi:hypothetical protein
MCLHKRGQGGIFVVRRICAVAVVRCTNFQKFLKLQETFFKKFLGGCRAAPAKQTQRTKNIRRQRCSVGEVELAIIVCPLFLCRQKAQRKTAQQVARQKETPKTEALPRTPPSPF